MFNYVSLHSSITFYHIDLCSLHSYTTLYTPLKTPQNTPVQTVLI